MSAIHHLTVVETAAEKTTSQLEKIPQPSALTIVAISLHQVVILSSKYQGEDAILTAVMDRLTTICNLL
jgi:hypothetical protein